MPHLLRNRTYDAGALARWGELDAERRRLLTAVEAMKAERNTLSAEVGRKKRAKEDASAEMERARTLGVEVAAQEKRVEEIEGEFFAIEQTLPNVPQESVPDGEDSDANAVLKSWGEPTRFPFAPKPHWELGPALGILDFERAAKVTGARFTVLSGEASLLSRALIAFMLDLHTHEHGYREVLPPFIINGASLFGTGQLPKFEADLFRLQGTDWYLAPTAEVPVTNLHRDEVLRDDQLPISYCAYTPCFRAEAGAAGVGTRGMIRVHQFDKVEMIQIVRPEEGYAALEQMVQCAERVLQAMGLHYRVVLLCTGDMGFASAKTYDLEVWAPGQGAYLEVSSVSNCEDFQARRMNLRFKREADGHNVFPHVLNGSGTALARLFVALVESYQQADGSVVVPEPLRPYLRADVLRP